MDFLPVMRMDKSSEFYESMQAFVSDVHSCVSALDAAVGFYCDGKTPECKKSANAVIDFETKADMSRRKLEKMLYTGVVLPFGRGAKYELLESVDDVADKAEIVARLLLIEKLSIPKTYRREFKELVSLVLESVEHLKNAILSLDSNLHKAVSFAQKVENTREEARKLEFRLIHHIFSKKVGVEVILLKELITLIGNVADMAEESADRVISLAVKYQG